MNVAYNTEQIKVSAFSQTLFPLFCANGIIETCQPTLIKFKVVQFELLELSLLLHNRFNTQPYNGLLKLFQHLKQNFLF